MYIIYVYWSYSWGRHFKARNMSWTHFSRQVRSDGLWKCGTDQMGLPYKVDPAPWHIKHCWCTPASRLRSWRILASLELLARKGGLKNNNYRILATGTGGFKVCCVRSFFQFVRWFGAQWYFGYCFSIFFPTFLPETVQSHWQSLDPKEAETF